MQCRSRYFFLAPPKRDCVGASAHGGSPWRAKRACKACNASLSVGDRAPQESGAFMTVGETRGEPRNTTGTRAQQGFPPRGGQPQACSGVLCSQGRPSARLSPRMRAGLCGRFRRAALIVARWLRACATRGPPNRRCAPVGALALTDLEPAAGKCGGVRLRPCVLSGVALVQVSVSGAGLRVPHNQSQALIEGDA